MSDCPTNGFPPSPQGACEKDGAQQGRRGIVPVGGPQGSRPALSLPSGLFFCALGGAVASSTFSFLAPVFVGYGYVSAADCGGTRGRLMGAAAALVAAVALSFSLGASSVVAAIASCLVALVTVEALLAGRLTPGLGCLVVAGAAVCTFGADSLVAATRGTTVAADVESLLSLYAEEFSSVSVTAASLVQQVRSVLSVLWPTAYVVSAFGSYLFAVIGAGAAARKTTERTIAVPRLVDYDLPLWVVAVLVAAAAVLAFGLTVDGPAADAALMASANVVMGLRLAFAAQGLAVLVWFLNRNGSGALTKALLGALALYLEVQFVVLTVVGLVDVWANLRHLPRGESSGAQGTA